VDTKYSQKCQQNPGDVIIDSAFSESQIRPTVHTGYQKQVDNPTDKKQAQGKKINSSGYGMSIIKPMGSRKTKNPQNIANGFAVRVIAVAHFISPNLS
jgi:hypothetical protein